MYVEFMDFPFLILIGNHKRKYMTYLITESINFVQFCGSTKCSVQESNNAIPYKGPIIDLLNYCVFRQS